MTTVGARSVLVIDDDEPPRETVGSLLDDEGYLVEMAPDGQSALQRLRETQDRMVVLVDLRMPRVDGLQVLRAVEKDARLATQHCYILFTADARPLEPETEDLLTRLHAPIVLKPFDIDGLLGVLGAAVQRLV